jgi:lysophospholipase L1-like esterase
MRKYLLIVCLIVVSCSREPLNKKNIFIGDSNIQRWDLNYYFPGAMCINEGISGSLINDANDKIKSLKLNTYDQCFIETGTNDLRKYLKNNIVQQKGIDSVISNYDVLLSNAETHFSKIYVIGIIPLSSYNNPQGTAALYKNVNDKLKIEVQSFPKTVFIDIYPVLANKDNYLDATLTQDGLHLNPNGYEKLSATIRNFVY